MPTRRPPGRRRASSPCSLPSTRPSTASTAKRASTSRHSPPSREGPLASAAFLPEGDSGPGRSRAEAAWTAGTVSIGDSSPGFSRRRSPESTSRSARSALEIGRGLRPGERAFLLLHTEAAEHRRRLPSTTSVAHRSRDRFLASWNAERLSRSLVVVTATTGENLFDRSSAAGGRAGHHLHDELTHVHSYFAAPGLVPARGAVPGPVSLLDVMPTLLSLVGVAPPDYRIQGQDLRSTLQLGHPLDPARALFAGAPLQGPLWRTVRTASSKYIISPRVTGSEWWHSVVRPPEADFDLRRDPAEREEVSAASRAVRHGLRAVLRDRQRDEAILRDLLGPGGVAPGNAALRSLGYIR